MRRHLPSQKCEAAGASCLGRTGRSNAGKPSLANVVAGISQWLLGAPFAPRLQPRERNNKHSNVPNETRQHRVNRACFPAPGIFHPGCCLEPGRARNRSTEKEEVFLFQQQLRPSDVNTTTAKCEE